MVERQESSKGQQGPKGLFKEAPSYSWGYQHPLNRASFISAKQSPFSFRQDISHLPVVWAGLGIGFVFAQLKVSRTQGPPTLPHLPFSALKDSLLKRTGGSPRSHSLLLVPFLAVRPWVNLSRPGAISTYPLRPLGSLLFRAFPHTLPFVMASPGSLCFHCPGVKRYCPPIMGNRHINIFSLEGR